MSWLSTSHQRGWHYLFIRLPFHKSLEVGWQDTRRYEHWSEHLDLMLRFNIRGQDHAGFKFFFQFWRFFFEFNLIDTRHWNFERRRWVRDSSEEAYVGCDTGQEPVWLHGGDANPDGPGRSLDE